VTSTFQSLGSESLKKKDKTFIRAFATLPGVLRTSDKGCFCLLQSTGKRTAKGQGEEGCNNNYIEQFFVGLLEGDGTITTNINSTSKTIRVRIIIALKNDINNQIMLNKIQKIIGGRVVIERKDKYVT
jgi:hypothetical protein